MPLLRLVPSLSSRLRIGLLSSSFALCHLPFASLDPERMILSGRPEFLRRGARVVDWDGLENR